MKRNLFASVLIVALVCVAFPRHAFSAIPQTINYQGRLLDSSGLPMEGVITMTFTFFSSLTGGSALWNEAQDLELNNGYFNVLLGAVTAFPAGLFNNPLYIEMAIGSETLSPRKPLASAPYALVAAKALQVPVGSIQDDAVTSSTIAASAVTSAAIENGTVATEDIAAGAVTESWSGSASSTAVSAGAAVDLITLSVNLAHDGTVLVMAKATTSGFSLAYGRVTYTISADGTTLDTTDNAILGNTTETQYFSAALLGRTSLTAGNHTIKLTVTGGTIDDSEQVSVSDGKLTVVALYK